MLFSSNLFLFLFLPLVVAGYYLLGARFRNAFLLIMSLLFYAWGEPSFVLVMMGSILFNYLAALLINRCRNTVIRKWLLAFSVAGNLGILFIFKYLDFAIININRFGLNLPLQYIALPLGISFFTFQAMSYVIDVYRGTAKVQKSPLNIGLYVAFFPQLIAGPIVRYQTIADQIEERHENFDDFSEGIRRFIVGLSKKILLSNNMALVADAVFGTADAQRSVVFAWLGVIAYGFQIFFDFSGYSDMAIGLGKLFGFHFLENFDYPFIAKSVSEFWRRWHMSLGQWFRDYVYFPLGGSRVKTTGRQVFNLFVVWGLTGVWHGASWNFIIWGLLFFVLITFEKLTGWPNCFRHNWQKQLYRLFTMVCILFSWAFFRSSGASTAITYCLSMFGLTGNEFMNDVVIRTWLQHKYFFLASVVCSVPVFPYIKQKIANRSQRLERIMNALSVPMYLFLVFWAVSYLMIGSHNPFIYFNF